MRMRMCLAMVSFGVVVASAAPAFACGGLIGPNGAVNLTRTTTLAAYHNGLEHYVTAFNYEGGGGKFGSIVPLPAMPSKVEKGGAWTLQRLQRETEPQVKGLALSSAGVSGSGAQEVYKTRIDALDITVLKGGGASVGIWASQHGFRLPPDAPEVLDFYAGRSLYFMAAVFDSKAAKDRGQQIGDGTPIHITIPLRNPWVPLRILGLGKRSSDFVGADVYLLTHRAPNLLPAAGPEYQIERQVPASSQLLTDLRSDRGMSWMPTSGMTLTHLIVDSTTRNLRYDLATNVHGGLPSRWRAGLPPLPTPFPTRAPTPTPKITPAPVFTNQVLAAPVGASESAWPLAAAFALVIITLLGAWRVLGKTSRTGPR